MLILEDGKLWGASGRRKPLLSEFINKKILLKESRAVSFLERMSYLQHRMSVPLGRTIEGRKFWVRRLSKFLCYEL